MGASIEEGERDVPGAAPLPLSSSAARSTTISSTKAWKAEADTPCSGVVAVVGDDTDEDVVCDEVDGDVVPEEEVVAALDPGEAAGAVGWLLAPLPPLLPLPFLGFALPPVPSGLVWVGIATSAVAASSHHHV